MAGGGGYAGDGAANGGHPLGTEYTLQGMSLSLPFSTPGAEFSCINLVAC